jgi:hypothetical protein
MFGKETSCLRPEILARGRWRLAGIGEGIYSGLLAFNLGLVPYARGISKGIKFLEMYHFIRAYYPSCWYHLF